MGGVLVAVLPALGQRLEDHPVQGLGDIGRQRGGALGNLPHVLVGDGHGGVALEGRLAGEQLVKETPGGVQVRAGVHGLAAGLLWGEVLGGAHHCVGLGDRGGGVLNGPRDAEVHDLHRAGGGQHDVSGLDVAVDDPHPVGVLQGVQDTGDDLHRLRNRDGLALAEELAHRVPLDVLHDDVGDGAAGAARLEELLLTGVVDGDDGGVVERRRGLGLPAEAGLEGGVAGDVRTQQLDGHDPRQASVVAEVHLCHTTTSDEVADLVTAREDLGELTGHSTSLTGMLSIKAGMT